VSANSTAVSTGGILKLDIATTDLALTSKGERWLDNLDQCELWW
jgi:hypothetical protein